MARARKHVSIIGVAAMAWGVILGVPAAATLHQYPVILQNDDAPGVTPGAKFQNFSPIMIGEGGKFAFHASSVSGNGAGSTGYWTGTISDPPSSPPFGLAPVAVRGDSAPGTTETFNAITGALAPSISANTNLAFQHDLAIGGSVTASNNTGIWAKTGAGLNLVAREGSTAPGTSATFSSFGAEGPSVNDAGNVAVVAFLSDSTNGIWRTTTSPGTLTLVARTGDSAPGTGKVFNTIGANFSGPRLASNGSVAFSSTLTTTFGGPETGDTAIWIGGPGTLTQVARVGDVAPDTSGATWTSISPHLSLNRNGQVAFFADAPGGITSVWAGSPGNLRLIVKRNAPAVGISGSFWGASLNTPNIGQGGHAAVNIDFHGASAGRGIWVGTSSSDVRLVGREGQQAAGTSTGVLFTSIGGGGQIASDGDVLFTSFLTGPGVVTSGTGRNNEGIWLFDFQSEVTQLVVRVNDLIEVLPSDFRTVSAFSLHNGAGLHTGNSAGFSADGRMVYTLYFTDGSFGLFTVPEPTSMAVLGCAALMILGRRRAARCQAPYRVRPAAL